MARFARTRHEPPSTLGVKKQALSFIGFPDEGLCELASTYLFAKARAFEPPFTERISPLTEQVIRGVRYRGIHMRREFERLVSRSHLR